MKNKLLYGKPSAEPTAGFTCALAAAIMAVAAAASATGCSSKSDDEQQRAAATANNVTLTAAQQQNIRLATVEQAGFHKTIDTNGVVDFDNDQSTSVLAPFSGPVARLLVSPGDKVRKGDPLAVVDSPDFAGAVSTYRKAIATARTNRRLADLDKDLVEHQGVAEREAAQAETDATNAEADRDAALKALVSLQVPSQTIKDIQEGRPVPHLEGMIRSPVTGTVAEKLITPGQLLQAGTTPCFTVADLSRVWVMAQIFGSDLTSVSVGDSAEVVTGISDNRFSGTVDNISTLVNPDTRAVIARVVVTNPGDFLKKQMYVHVLLQAREASTGLLVPVGAVLRDDENLPYVYVAQPDGTFARQHVTLGYREADRIDITAGLKAGDRIVVDGGLFVQFMQIQ
jgi:cobalt-zinc-cadmium efflux system membrane fusion protein